MDVLIKRNNTAYVSGNYIVTAFSKRINRNFPQSLLSGKVTTGIRAEFIQGVFEAEDIPTAIAYKVDAVVQ